MTFTMMMQFNSTDILLVGKTGCGKSQTANTIVGHNVCNEKPRFRCYAEVILGGFEGRLLKVVSITNEASTRTNWQSGSTISAETAACSMAVNPCGYHAILYILRYGARYTREDVNEMRTIMSNFGPDFIAKHGILLMTHGDEFSQKVMGDFDKWIVKQGGAIKEIFQECQGRVVLFDNKSKNSAVRLSQVKKLLTLIDQLPGKGARYTHGLFKTASENVKRRFEQSIIPKLSESSMTKCSLISQHLARLDFDNPEVTVRQTKALKLQVQQLLEKVIAEDIESNSLNGSIALAKQLQISVEDQFKFAITMLRFKGAQNDHTLGLGLKQIFLKEERKFLKDHAKQVLRQLIQKEKQKRQETKKMDEEKERQKNEENQSKEFVRHKEKESEWDEKLERSNINEMEREEELNRLKIKISRLEEKLERMSLREKELKEQFDRENKNENTQAEGIERQEIQEMITKEMERQKEELNDELSRQRRDIEILKILRIAQDKTSVKHNSFTSFLYFNIGKDLAFWALKSVGKVVQIAFAAIKGWWWGL